MSSILQFQQRKESLQQNLHKYLKRKKGTQDEINSAGGDSKFVHLLLTNQEKLHFFALVELLRLDLREHFWKLACSSDKQNGAVEDDTLNESCIQEASQLESELTDLITAIGSLGYSHRRHHWTNTLDDLVRLLAAWLIFCSAALLFPIPFLVLKGLNKCLASVGIIKHNRDIYSPAALLFNQSICKVILLVSAIKVDVSDERSAEGIALMNSHRSVTCYNHTSTIDAFVLPAVIPHFTYMLAKKELFALPFFSWLVAVFGGIPIDRKNRDSAVQSLRLAADSVKCGQTVTIAPEGTRSTTGLMLPFKKGPFYLWEAMHQQELSRGTNHRSPAALVQPVLIIGASELFPPSSLFSVPGVAQVRFLEPIHPSELPSVALQDFAYAREAMSNMLRRRLLAASISPTITSVCENEKVDIAISEPNKSLSTSYCALSRGVLLMSIVAHIVFFRFFYKILSAPRPDGYHLSKGEIMGWGTALTVGITLSIFIYYTIKLKRSDTAGLKKIN